MFLCYNAECSKKATTEKGGSTDAEQTPGAAKKQRDDAGSPFAEERRTPHEHRAVRNRPERDYLAYGSNLKEVISMVEEAVNNQRHQAIDPEKRAKVVVTEMADSSVNMKLVV